MTPKTIHLNKLLKLFQLHDQPLVSELRKALRMERDRLLEAPADPRDFYSPFWADAKMHLRGFLDLRLQTELRIESSKQRGNLYPRLAHGYLKWLDDNRRGTNQIVGWHEIKAHEHHLFEDLDLTLKVDNLLPLKIGQDSYRLVYPYFFDKPELSERWARVGLWAMSETLTDFSITDMEVLDVIRGRGFRGTRLFLKGDEESLFAQRYSQVLKVWDGMRHEYGL